MAPHISATVGVLLSALLVCLLTQLPSSSAQLPCTHPIRHVRPELFKHCDDVCRYTTWSSWRKVPNSRVSVPPGKCPSGEAYTEERTRRAIGNGCTGSVRETQSICLPTQEERLIIGLGLGGSGNNFDPHKPGTAGDRPPSVAGPPAPPRQGVAGPPRQGVAGPPGKPGKPGLVNAPIVFAASKCPKNDNVGRVCRSIPGIGKRSVQDTEEDILPLPQQEKVVRDDLDPIPFDWYEHGPRLRSRRQATCGDQTTQHVLFVLDTSGSIGSAQFDRLTSAIALLPVLFCKQVKFAVITFSSYVNLEFCFDCFENTFDGRGEVSTAIQDIVYRGGSTNTGATAKCVCEEILQPSCGIDAYPDCLDVVFITDGKSNDPTLKICEEVECLHSRLGIDTYAIGINSGAGAKTFNRAELDCITNFSDLTSVFEFESFEDFENAIIDIFDRLLIALPDSPESCARLDNTISPTGAPPFGK